MFSLLRLGRRGSGLFTTVFGPSYSVMTQYAGSSLLSPDEVRGVFQGSLPCGGQNRLAPPLLSGVVFRWKGPLALVS